MCQDNIQRLSFLVDWVEIKVILVLADSMEGRCQEFAKAFVQSELPSVKDITEVILGKLGSYPL